MATYYQETQLRENFDIEAVFTDCDNDEVYLMNSSHEFKVCVEDDECSFYQRKIGNEDWCYMDTLNN